MPKLDSPKLDDNPTDNMMASIEGLWDTANSAVQADLKKRVNKKTRKKSAEPAPPVEASSASGTPSTDDEAISRLKDMGNLRVADSGAADSGAADSGAPSDLADSGAPSDLADSGAPSDLADSGAPLAPEALFSDAFSKLVQQVVEDYLDKNLAPMISKAVQAELKKKPKTRRKTANKAK